MNSKSPIFTAQSDVALRIHVDRAVRHYFAQLQGEQPSQVYDMVPGRNGETSSICSF